MKRIIQFGEQVPGYTIPVLNEREIRASAGLLFIGTFLSLVLILSDNNFVPAKYFITFFLTDLLIRVLINPKYSPTLIIGRLIVRNQVPEYVGAQQKRFAWIIGIILASIMYIFLIVVNSFSPVTGITCLVCLLFLFFESAFGICLGCKVYSLFYKKKAQYCPGEVCDRKLKHDIQKTSITQWLVVAAFIMYVLFVISFAKTYYSKPPHNLSGMYGSSPLNK